MARPSKVQENATQADKAIARLAAHIDESEGSETAIPNDAQSQQPANEDQPAETPKTEEVKASESNQLDQDSQAWEQKYKVLEGKYRSEMPRLQSKLKELEGKLDNQPDETAIRQSIAAEFEQQTAQIATTPNASLDNLRSEYGAELIDGLIGAMRAEVAPLQQSVNLATETAGQSAKDTKYSILREKLAAKGVSFDQVNSSEDFVGWLNLPPASPYMPIQNNVLKQAFAANDYETVVGIFLEYAGELQSGSASPNQVPNPLAGSVEMPSSASASFNNGNGQKVWTQQEISNLYAKKPKPGSKGMDDWRALEIQLFASQASPG